MTVLYINGDSHAAGAEAVLPFAFAEDDSAYPPPDRRPHPINVEASFGNTLARNLGTHWIPVNDSESASSNDRIIRTTEEWLANNQKPSLVLIGWTTWERQEWLHNGIYYQVNSSGYDSVPEELQHKYKCWVIEQADPEQQKENELKWHQRIWDWHNDLTRREIPHLFFNTYLYYHNVVAHSLEQYDWEGAYIAPYDPMFTYYQWLKNKGIDTVNPQSYHFGINGHRKWAYFLKEYIDNNF